MRSARRLVLQVLLAWLSCAPLLAQQYAFRSYTEDDGLGNLSITALAQDTSGFLWVGTENGLYRFDGSRFDRFGLAEGLEQTYVSALHVDQDGRLWVGTTEHLYLWEILRQTCDEIEGNRNGRQREAGADQNRLRRAAPRG